MRTRNVSVLPWAGSRPRSDVEPVRRLDPSGIKQLCASDFGPDFQEVFIFHDESAIVIIKPMF